MRRLLRGLLLPLLFPTLLPGTPCAQAAPEAQDAQEPAPGPPPPPPPRGLVLHDPTAAYEGYTLIAPFSQDDLLLIDMEGEVVHRWVAPGTESAIFLEDGGVLRWGMTPESLASMEKDSMSTRRFQGPGVAGGVVEELDWDGNVRWRYVLDTDTQLLHHDIALLPNGNVLILVWEYHSREEAIAAGRDPAQVNERGLWADAIHEVERRLPEGGEVVWSWRAWDHLVQDFDETKANYGSVPDAPGRLDLNYDHRDRPPMTPEERAEQEELERQMAALGYGGEAPDEEDDGAPAGDAPEQGGRFPDWLHSNAIDHLPAHDLLVLSSPHLSEIFVLDHSTTTKEAAGSSGGRFGRGGELLWRWGNPRNYGAGTDADQRLAYQHDPQWLPTKDPDELRLLVFNNGAVRPGRAPFSSVDELVLPFDPKKGFRRDAGRPYGPSELAWTYQDPGTFFSPFISGTQRLPNGNTLICSGVQARVFEVTPDGRVVWDFENDFVGTRDFGIPGTALYRAVRIGRDHPALRARL